MNSLDEVKAIITYLPKRVEDLKLKSIYFNEYETLLVLFLNCKVQHMEVEPLKY